MTDAARISTLEATVADQASYLDTLASAVADYGSKFAEIKLADLTQKISPTPNYPGVPTPQSLTMGGDVSLSGASGAPDVSVIFVVAATGTITIAVGPTSGNCFTASVDNIAPPDGTWPSGYPANQFFTQGQLMPYFRTDAATGVVIELQEGRILPGTASGTVKATFLWRAAGGMDLSATSATVRYYIYARVTV